MDISILSPDEFEVECLVRNIEGDPLSKLESLKKAITNEEENPVLRPFRAHAAARSAPQRELQKCALKIKEHREWVVETKPAAETHEDALRKVEVRLLHVKARIERLLSSTRSYKPQCRENLSSVEVILSGVQNLQQGNVNLDETLTKIKEAQAEEPDDLSTSEDEEISKETNKVKTPTSTKSVTSPTNDNDGSTVSNLSNVMSSTNIVIREPVSSPAQDQMKLAEERRNVDASQYRFTSIMSKWKISFGGDSQELPIERFLFRVEHLAGTTGVPRVHLVDHLGLLLTGVASNWYWCHIERNPNTGWSKLKQDMVERFQDRRTEHDLRRHIESRKQKPNENFRSFYNDIIALSLQFRNHLPDSELLHIVRRNMRTGFQNTLADQEFSSLPALVRRCLALEDTWNRTGYEPERLCTRRYIHEVSLDESEEGNIHVDEIASQSRNKYPMSRLRDSSCSQPGNENLTICWNCQDIGHAYSDCSKPPKIFCFGCGRSGILKPKCFRCSGNSSTRFRTSGNSIPQTTILPRTHPTEAGSNVNPELPQHQQSTNRQF